MWFEGLYRFLVWKLEGKRPLGKSMRMCVHNSRLDLRGGVRKPEGKSQLGRPGRRWVDNIRMDLGGGGSE